MSRSRRVLAVDEQRATLEFLHSVLPLVEGERFEILRVLSAEEGLLELRRTAYDLLITGLRLPGMDGLELSRRAKRLRPAMGVIMATSRPLDEMSEPATSNGVDHLLHKPLDAEAFLAAVKASLPAGPPPLVRNTASAAGDVPADVPADLPKAVIRRLETLGDETGAGQVVLASVAGEILYVTGGQLHGDIPQLVAAASTGVSRALDLSGHLNEGEPRAVQFVAGATTDLYWVNVGRDYFLTILFDAQLRRGRIGTVWVFTQRAVSDLKRLLARRAPNPPGSSEAPARRQEPDTAIAQADEAADSPDPEGADEPPPDQVNEAGGDDLDRLQAAGAEMVEGGELARSAQEQALDDFWDDALAANSGQDSFSEGISLEEAKAKGLVAEDFNPEGWADEARP